jgi:hypothetical protein
VTTHVNTWIVGMSAALAAVILLITLAVVGRVDQARTESSRPTGRTALTAEAALAADRAAQTDLRNAIVAAKTIQIDENSYASADSAASGLAAVEASLCYVGPGTISVSSGAVCESGVGGASISVSASADGWAAARMSASGTCFWIADDASGVRYGAGTPCTGTVAAGAAASGW